MEVESTVAELKLRPDFEQIRRNKNETRSGDQLAAHYVVERELAIRLAASDPADRAAQYTSVYRELFARVKDHPQHRGDRAGRHAQVVARAASLSRLLDSNSTFVEIGCGDALLTKEVAQTVRMAIGVDVTGELVTQDGPSSFRFVQTDGIGIDIDSDTVDLVFSNQVVEHLHVDDALVQAREIHRILKPGGR